MVRPDRLGHCLREADVGTAGFEQRGSGYHVRRACLEQVASALDRPHAAADATRQSASNPADELEVVAGAHGGIEVDDLDFRKPLESFDPAEHVIVADRKPFALNELNDGAVFEIDGRNQHAKKLKLRIRN